MKKTLPFLLLAVLSCSLLLNANPGSPGAFKKVNDGVIVTLAKPASGGVKSVKVSVISEKIMHVIASPAVDIISRPGLMVIPQKSFDAYKVSEKNGMVLLQTASLVANVSTSDGSVRFTTPGGKPILSEATGSRIIEPAPVDGESQFHVVQQFNSQPGEAFYGLGQHQDGTMNYRGKSVTLLQQNSDVAIPFMISSRHYGILWENYSITRFGDTREYEQLSKFRLYDKIGNAGGLTTTYSNPGKIFTERTEAEIDYPFLPDQKKFPAGYKMTDGTVTWEGTIESEFTGAHWFRSYYAGYTKIWVDGKLQLDNWRQAWNPATATFAVNLEKGRKTPIKIEWKPDGGESYISLKFLSPLPANKANQFGFDSEAGDNIDYYFVYGSNADEVISGYRLLTGKATLVPKWAMGFWQSRERYKTQEEILNTVAEFRKRGIGLDNIVEDWSYWKEDQWGSHDFDSTRFPDVTGMIKTLHDQYHTHFMISVWPKFYTNTANYKAMNDKGYLYKRNVEIGRRDWIGAGYTSTFYDAYNAGARQDFWKQLDEKLFSKGVDAFWMDASEPDIHSNVSIEERKDFMNPTAPGNSTRYFNAYALVNAQGIYEGQRTTAPDQRVFILTRSAYGGMQRFAAATWSGDVGARWVDMRNQISGGVNFGMSGMPYWTMDIGGFAVERRYEHPNEADKAEWQEQMTRWYQFGAFAPIFRVHGQFPYREIYNTAPDDHPAYKSMLYYNRLRYRLMPYIYSLAGMTYQNDYTIMRGLPMDFGTDEKVKNINDQFMFGPALLVNPVTEYKATSRKLYLPAGNTWYNAYNGKQFAGGQTITGEAPYERMPLFVKAGAIIPMGPAIQYTMEKQPDTLTVFVYAGSNGSFSLYDDEGVNYNYEKGRFTTIPFSWNDGNKTLTIGERMGSFDGMLNTRTIRVLIIDKEHPRPLDADLSADKTVRYDGKRISIQL